MAGSMRGRALDVDRLGAAAEDHAGGTAGRDLGRGDRVRDDLGVDVRLAHPPGDELRVLRAEVDDEDRSRRADVTVGRSAWRRAHGSPWRTTSSAFCSSLSEA